MNHRDQLKLAEAILVIRPDWQQAGVMAQLNILVGTWQQGDPKLFAHAMTVAANPAAKTPGAFNTPMPAIPKPGTSTGTQERCSICGNLRTQCEKLYEIETRAGLPDTHHFETGEAAEQNSSRATAQRKQEAIAALAKSKSIP